MLTLIALDVLCVIAPEMDKLVVAPPKLKIPAVAVTFGKANAVVP